VRWRPQELDPGHTEAQEDMATIAGLLEQQTQQLVGLPGLVIAADPGEWDHPACAAQLRDRQEQRKAV
jgi:hypothetical protein